MLNAAAAVSAAQRPFSIIHTSGAASIGANIQLDASDSFAADGRSITGIQWSVTDVVGASPVIVAANEATTTMQLPGATSFTLKLMVTDDHGGQDTSTMSFATPTAPAPAPTPAPTPTPSTPATPPAKSSGGGGGEFSWELVLLLMLASARTLLHRSHISI